MSISRTGSGLWFLTLIVILAASGGTVAQPPKEVPKYPPIAPDKAKLEQTFRGLDGPGLALAAQEETMMVAAGCSEGTIQLWHKDCLLGLRDGSDSANILSGHSASVLSLAWNGTTLASAGADKKILLWDVFEGKILHTLETGPLVRALALSPDGKILAGVGDSQDVRLWDVAMGKAAGELKGHADWIQCLRFSDDGKQLLTAGYESQAILWDVAGAKKIQELPAPPKEKPKTPPEPDPIAAVAFSPDGKQALIGRADGNIDQVNIADGAKIRSLTGHASAVTGLLYHPSGTLIISCSKDGSIRLWNAANGTLIKALTDHTAWVEGISLIGQGTRLVSVSADQTVRVWALTG